MTTTDARGWINALIKAMHEETSGSWPDPEYKDEVYSALEMAVQALSQEPCDDAISREDKKHIDGFKYWCETNEENGTITIPKFVCNEIVKILDKFSLVTPRTNCQYRHENGNCLKVGGFCTSVDDKHCPSVTQKGDVKNV